MSQALEIGTAPDLFALYAIRYASRDGVRGQHFHGWERRSDEPHPTDYFVWLARSSTRTVVIDAGMSPQRAAAATGVRYRGAPSALLAELDVSAESVDDVVLTHLHYDHTGCAWDFPTAVVHVQRRELDYWEGPLAARNRREHWLATPADIARVRAGIELGSTRLADGDVELMPGLSVHLVGGHTAGMQVVRVHTRRGHVVVASDASHYFENIEQDHPFAILHDVPGMFSAFDRINELADSPAHIAPGHDPELFARFDAVASYEGDIAILH